jgi:hypothetical protein
MSESAQRSGACLCGSVRVITPAATHKVGACHCSICRKWGGGPFMSVNSGSDVSFEGEESVRVYNSSAWAERGFCGQCGTHLFYRLKKSGLHFVPAGLFDETGDFVLNHQVFVDERPAFYCFANETKNMTGSQVFAMFASS